MKSPKNIVIFVLSGKYNLGDELILRVEIDFFKSKFPNATIHVATYDENSFLGDKKGIQFFSFFPNGIRKFFFKNIWYFFANIAKIFHADLVVLGGGGIFFDNEPGISFKKNLFEWKLRLLFARLFRKKVIFLGISLEVKNYENQKKLAKIFRNSDYIFPRDERSTKILEQFWIPATTLSDSVFLFPPKNFSQKNIIKIPENKQKIITVWFALRAWFLTEFSVEELSKFVEELSNKWYNIIFITHSFSAEVSHNDEIFVKKFFGEQYRITASLDESLRAYDEIDVMISMRLHATIMASQNGIPVLMIPYGPKTLSLASILAIPTLIDPNKISQAYLGDQFSYLENNFSLLQDKISAKYEEIHTNFLQKIDKLDIIEIS